MKLAAPSFLLLSSLVGALGCGGSDSDGEGGKGATETASHGGSTTPSSATGVSGATSGTESSGSSPTGATSSSTGGATPMPLGCVTDVSAGHHVFPCDGGITYDVEVPTGCASGGCGLIVDVHGFTMDASQEEAATGMRGRGNDHGYVVVQPTAPGVPHSWDQATHAPLLFSFVSDMATAMAIDPHRRHMMGFSQGGGMTWRMVCSHADFFASAAPLGGITGCEFSGPNVPSREVPMVMTHGHLDNVVSFTGIAIPQRDAALAYWGDGAGTVFDSDPAHTATRYETAAGTIFEFYEHDYTAGSAILGGHCSPGGSDVGASPFQFGCQQPGTFVYGEVAMQFFLDHPLP